MRRHPERSQHDTEVLYALLDEALVAHVGLVEGGHPVVLPTAFARDSDTLLIHGSTGGRLFRTAASGAPLCVTVTSLDALVYARSLFNSSMNYRSAVIFGCGSEVTGSAKVDALRVLSEHLMPGRWAEARQPTTKELAATLVVAIPLEEASVKVRSGPPEDDDADLSLPVWAGVVPLATAAEAPITAAGVSAPIPAYLSMSRSSTSR